LINSCEGHSLSPFRGLGLENTTINITQNLKVNIPVQVKILLRVL
jgi:hypothetical protein